MALRHHNSDREVEVSISVGYSRVSDLTANSLWAWISRLFCFYIVIYYSIVSSVEDALERQIGNNDPPSVNPNPSLNTPTASGSVSGSLLPPVICQNVQTPFPFRFRDSTVRFYSVSFYLSLEPSSSNGDMASESRM